MNDIIPGVWAKKLEERYIAESDWMKILEKMMPYTRGESWRESLNRYVSYLNSEHERKLHPERFYGDRN